VRCWEIIRVSCSSQFVVRSIFMDTQKKVILAVVVWVAAALALSVFIIPALTGFGTVQVGNATIAFIPVIPHTLTTPDDPFTASFTIVGNVSGVMENGSNSTMVQLLSFFEGGSTLRMDLVAFFNAEDVNLSDLVITTTATSIAVDHRNVTGVGNKTLYLSNTQNLGVFVCLNATSVSEVTQSCPGVLKWSQEEAVAGVTKDGIQTNLTGGVYAVSNLSGSGVGEVPSSRVGGGGGSGGAGGAAVNRSRIPHLYDLVGGEGKTSSLVAGDGVRALIARSNRVLHVIGVRDGVVTLNFETREGDFTLRAGQVKLLDFTGDGASDVSVRVVLVSGSEVVLEIAKVGVPVLRKESPSGLAGAKNAPAGVVGAKEPVTDALEPAGVAVHVIPVSQGSVMFIAGVLGLIVLMGVVLCLFMVGQYSAYARGVVKVAPAVRSGRYSKEVLASLNMLDADLNEIHAIVAKYHRKKKR